MEIEFFKLQNKEYMNKIEQQLDELSTQRQKLLVQLDKQRANKQFRCGCGAMHRIKDCVLIQTHWYVEPYGCTGGAYWNQGELQIVCPVDDTAKNRLMFSNDDVPYDDRGSYVYNADLQFKRMYKGLFKEVVDDYEKDKRGSWNNYYIDKNHTKFGLCVKGRDYTKYVGYGWKMKAKKK